MRRLVFAIAAVFIALFGYVTVADFIKHGVNVLGIMSAVIVIFMLVGIINALRQPPEH
jgi:UDP-N-acetylmuramyl pentapeptide phosphotransferase/UDP-N-acetylglucosamine-1-phosphate transferase